MRLEDYAHALGVEIATGSLASDRWGEWDHRTGAIRLRSDLSPPVRSYVLAHELGHAYHRHVGCHPRTEHQADIFAATLLIAPSEWRMATRMYDTVEAVANHLEVLPHVVRVYHAHLERQL